MSFNLTLDRETLKNAKRVASTLLAIEKAYRFHRDGESDTLSEKNGRAAMRRIGMLVLRRMMSDAAKVPFHNLDGMLAFINGAKTAALPVVERLASMRPTAMLDACTVEAARHMFAVIVERADAITTLRKEEVPALAASAAGK